MRFGVTLPTSGVGDDPMTVVDLAVEAEAAGWDGAFIWDYPFAGPEWGEHTHRVHEAWVMLAAIAVRTERIMIGTMITALPWRTPWLVAKQASTLQALSRGRFVLSVGLGSPPPDGSYFYEETGRRKRAAMLDEGLSILRGLWSGEPLTHGAEHYRVRNGPTMLPVADPRPTVWVVGAWNHDPDAWPKKKSFRRALAWDGLLPHFFKGSEMVGGAFKPEGIRELSEDIARERSDPFDLIVEGGGKDDENASPKTVRALRDAGATWWLEAVWESMYRHPGEPAVLFDRVRNGPPQL
jgi:hypothetical protein